MNKLEGFGSKDPQIKDFGDSTSLNRGLYGFTGSSGLVNPKAIPGLHLWLSTRYPTSMYQDITTPMKLANNSGDPVGTWLDLSGNGRHVYAGTTARRPTLSLNAVNNCPALTFDGTDDFLATLYNIDITGYSPRTLITVAKEYSPAGYPAIAGWGPNANNQNYWYNTFQGFGLNIDNGSTFTGRSVVNNTFSIGVSTFYDPFNRPFYMGIFRNNIASTSRNMIAGTGNSVFRVGLYNDSNSFFYYLNSQVVEVILYNRNLTTAERNYLEKGLGKAYGISVTNL